MPAPTIKRKRKKTASKDKVDLRGNGRKPLEMRVVETGSGVPSYQGIMDRVRANRRRLAKAEGKPESEVEAREVCEAAGWDPIEHLVLTALGDAVRLGLMTQEELDAPKREFFFVGKDGKPEVMFLSGRERALELIPVHLRMHAAREVAKYAYARRAPTLPEDGSRAVGEGVVVYLPSNGRGPDGAKPVKPEAVR